MKDMKKTYSLGTLREMRNEKRTMDSEEGMKTTSIVSNQAVLHGLPRLGALFSGRISQWFPKK